jgi:hypothetical protein
MSCRRSAGCGCARSRCRALDTSAAAIGEQAVGPGRGEDHADGVVRDARSGGAARRDRNGTWCATPAAVSTVTASPKENQRALTLDEADGG